MLEWREERAQKEKDYFNKVFSSASKEIRKPTVSFSNKRDEKIFDKIIDFLSRKKSRLMNYPPLLENIKKLVSVSDFYIRDIESLELKGKSPTKHFLQLVEHLLTKYPMPKFWDNVWEKGYKDEWCYWFIEVAQGGSVQKTAPIPITKKQAHRFMQSPSEYHPSEALRIVQFLDMGGDMIGAQGILSCGPIMRTTYKPSEEREEFNLELMRWFAQQAMLSPNKYEEIADWAAYKKFTAPPEDRQPGLRMKGRTIDAVLREVERWHDQMNRYRPLRRQNLDKITWEGDQIEDWIFEEHRGGDKPNRVWCFQQILCAKELLDEGRSQSHCVSSYIETCRRGQCSIWTMRDDGERALTIEIRDKTIRQARGKRNRQPTFKEIQILKRFASEKNLTVGRWIENGGGW